MAKKEERTEVDILKIAEDLYKGLIFTDRHMHQKDLLGQVFMPLLFMDKKMQKDLKKRKPAVVFEYLKEAGPRSINGMPIFHTCQFLSKEEWEAVVAAHEVMKKTMEGLKAGLAGPAGVSKETK